MPEFVSEVVLSAPIADVFGFLCLPTNLKKLAPPEIGLQFIAPPERLEEGVKLRFKVQSHGIVQEIEHAISGFHDPSGYVETLTKGPLKSYVNRTVLEAVSPTQTRLTNRVAFEPPGGLLGLMVTADRLLDSLEDGFAFRRMIMSQTFAG